MSADMAHQEWTKTVESVLAGNVVVVEHQEQPAMVMLSNTQWLEMRQRLVILECAIEALESIAKSKANPSRIVTGAEMRERMAARGVVGNTL